MSSNYFDQIEQKIALLQQRMVVLKAENEDLRQQVSKLRNGEGISIEIGGQRYAVIMEQGSEAGFEAAIEPEEQSLVLVSQEPEYRATPLVERVEEEEEEESSQSRTSTFLEEIMIDEFAAMATNQMAVWTGPLKKQERINEDQKAVLRRELSGSFLLE